MEKISNFVRENPAIAFGLGLPLLLVVIFLVVSGLPQLLVANPQYEVLYATGTHNYPNVVQITVVDRKVQLVYQGAAYGYERPRLWRYNPETGGVTEIAIILPPSPESPEDAQQTAIEVPDLAGVVVDASSVAPDGYEFRTADNRYSRNVFGGLFYSRRYNYEAVLAKNGRSIRLPNSNGRYYGSDTQFIGWILPQ